jgi:hypothetical protein
VLFIAKQFWRLLWTFSPWHGSRAARLALSASRTRTGQAATRQQSGTRVPASGSRFPVLRSSSRRHHHPSIQPSPGGQRIQSARRHCWFGCGRGPWPPCRDGGRRHPRIRNPSSKSRAPTRPAPRQSVFPGVLALALPRAIANHWRTAADTRRRTVPSPTWQPSLSLGPGRRAAVLKVAAGSGAVRPGT